MNLYTGAQSGFAIRSEDALIWHPCGRAVAGVAQRCGFYVRAMGRTWQVWATVGDFAALTKQTEPA